LKEWKAHEKYAMLKKNSMYFFKTFIAPLRFMHLAALNLLYTEAIRPAQMIQFLYFLRLRAKITKE